MKQRRGRPGMDVDVVTQQVIRRRRGEVARYVADPDNAPRWYENIKSVEWKSPRPLQVGSLVEFVAHFLGRRLRYTYETPVMAMAVRRANRKDMARLRSLLERDTR
jgi:hypothetical protein